MCRITMGYTGPGKGGRWEAVHTIHFGLYNIRNVRNGRIESVLQGMSQGNLDLVVFQEMKVTWLIGIRELGGYQVTATAALIPHCGSVKIFYC